MNTLDKISNLELEELSLEALESIRGGDGGPLEPVYDLFYWVGRKIGDAIWKRKEPETVSPKTGTYGVSGSW
jgi:hypothetical protein